MDPVEKYQDHVSIRLTSRESSLPSKCFKSLAKCEGITVLDLHISVDLESCDWRGQQAVVPQKVIDNIRTSKARRAIASLQCMNLMFTIKRHYRASRETRWKPCERVARKNLRLLENSSILSFINS